MKYLTGLILLLLMFSFGCSQSRDHGMTPLMKAANDGNLALVKELVEGGADIDAKHNKGFTVIEMMKSILARTPEKLQSDAEFMKKEGMDEEAVDEIIRGYAVPGNPSEEYFENIRLILEYLEDQRANQGMDLAR